jgi:hypothetical protein
MTSRNVTVPQSAAVETINDFTEYPGRSVTVRVFRDGDPHSSYLIDGAEYQQLLGDGAGWAAPGKPLGTFRNEDLWYFIDHKRAT